MITSFGRFLKESKNQKQLNYYAFDIDDNILIMPTVIHMERKTSDGWEPFDVSTSKFAQVREDSDTWRIYGNSMTLAFSEFRDSGPRGDMAFINDLRKAIYDKSFGPSWDDFIECLLSGSVFALITARGHSPITLRRGVEWILNNYLTNEQIQLMYNNLMKFDYLFKVEYDVDVPKIIRDIPSNNPVFRKYLNNCDFCGVTFNVLDPTGFNLEMAKEKALMKFKEKINRFAGNIGYKAIIGFSDDDTKNVKHIEDLVDNLKKEDFPNIIQYVVKNTSNRNNVTTKKRVVEYVDPSKQSVISSTTFGNMTSHLYPSSSDNRQDDFHHQLLKRVEFVKKKSDEITNREKRIKILKKPK